MSKIIQSGFYPKFILIVIIGFSIRLFFSCVQPPPIDMLYNSISLKGIDNSGEHIRRNYSDTLYSEALAIELTLTDSSMYYGSNGSRFFQDLSFNSAFAWSYSKSYQPINKVQEINVFTLFEINSTLLTGDEISDSVLYAFGKRYDLYYDEDAAIGHINDLQGDHSSVVYIIIKLPVENTRAQFNVVVSFEDGTVLSDTTNTFTIIPSIL